MKPRVIVEIDPAELRRREAHSQLAGPMCRLAANVMRVARGAGNPHEIGQQCVEVVRAYERYRELTGEWPDSGGLHSILSVERETSDHLKGEEREWARGEDTIVKGSLQVAASRLLGQHTQEAAGSRELFEGWEPIEAQRARNQRLTENAASPSSRGSRRRPKRDDVT